MKKINLSCLLAFLVICSLNGYAQTTTYTSVGTYLYAVPAGCTAINVDMAGAQGGASFNNNAPGGKGGRVQATLAVTAGMVLRIYVGGAGTTSTSSIGVRAGGANGADGGAHGGNGNGYGGGGGGSSDIRVVGTALSNRVLVAAGGGGGGLSCGVIMEQGGAGGGLTGGAGWVCESPSTIIGGQGATQTAGGGAPTAYSSYPAAGGLGFGGQHTSTDYTGGGGGGFYGGGAAAYGGGGGGSSFIGGIGVSAAVTTPDYRTGDGYVSLTPLVPELIATPTSLSLGVVTLATSSTVHSFSFSGSILSGFPDNITVTAPTGFQISMDGTTWFSSLTFPYTSATLAANTVFVRFSPTALGLVCGNVTISGGGATAVNVNVCGTGASVCTGVPTAGTAAITPSSGTSATIFNLSLSGTTIAGGLSYQWKSSPAPGGTYTDIPGANSFSYSVSGLSSTTYFRCDVRCPTFAVAFSNTVAATVGLATPACTGASANPNESCVSYAMYHLGFNITGASGSISDFSGCNSTGYLDHTSLSCTINAGATYTANVTSGSSNNVYNQIWIDFNGDGTFSSTETVGGDSTAHLGASAITLTIPPTVTPGAFRMRSVISWYGTAFNYPNLSPCQTGHVYGEARDYTVVIGPSCTTPPAITGTNHVCTSGTITLANATSGGTWSSSNTSTATVVAGTGIVTGVSPGTANISYTIAGGCYSTAMVTVLATPAAITGSLGMCVGSSSTLSSATPGGSWSSANTSVATIDPSTGLVLAIGTGTSTISYLSGGCISTAVVSVNATLGGNVGNSALCVGQTSLFTNTTVGGAWSSSNPAIAAISAGSGLVTAVSTGTANISYNLGSGCYAVTTVTVSSSPAAITGVMNVCPGSTSDLDHPEAGGAWSSSNLLKATVNNLTGVVTGISAGTTTITYALSPGCYRAATFVVNTLPASILGVASLCQGNTSTLTCSPGGGTWSSSGAAATVSSAGIITGVSAGTATVSYTTGSGCVSVRIITVNTVPTSISGTLGVCVGGTSTLSAAPGGGMWVSSLVGKATINAITGVVTGVTAGTTMISYTLAGGCRSTAIATVTAAPATITGSFVLCAGSTTALSSATTGGTWSSSNTSIATVVSGTGLVSGVSAGTATISYSNGTCERTRIVTVNAALSANTGSSTVCVGQSTALNNATGGGTWSSSSTAIATVNASSGMVAGVSASTVNISYRIGAGCYSITVVTVNTALSSISGTASVCPGGTTTLSHSDAGGVWSSSNAARATIDAGTGVVTGVSAGTVYITYTLGGCFRAIQVTVNGTPGAIGGTASMCAGATTALTCSPSGGTWSSSGSSIATVSGTGLVSGVGTGTATISYIRLGCAATRVVTVSEAPGAIGGTLSACIGTSTTLTSTPGGGTWTSSNAARATVGASTGLVTGVSVGTANITYAISATCRVTAVVTINSSAGAIGGSLTICESCTTTLDATTTGGVWSSSNTAAASIDAGTGVVTGVGVGTTTISYVAGGCVSSAVVTVVVAIPSSFGTPVVCVGQTNATMSNPVAGGTWSSSNAGIVTVHAANGLLTGVSTGNANITYTTSPGIYTIAVATVSPAVATITGTANICPGNTVTLSNATTGGTWYSSDNTKATVGAVSGVVTGVTTGTATITYEVNVGCYRVTMQIINPVPTNIGGPATVVNGSNINLSSSPGGGTWTSDNAGIASVVAGTGVVTGVSIGATTITYTLGTGCRTTRDISVVTSRPSSGGAESINQQAGHIKVYPNPTSGTLVIESGVGGVLTVFTIDGKEVARYEVSTRATTVSLPQHLAAGVYMCRFSGIDGTTAIVRLVYER